MRLGACKFTQVRHVRCRYLAEVREAGPGEGPALQAAAAPCLVSGADLLGGDVAQVPLAARADVSSAPGLARARLGLA